MGPSYCVVEKQQFACPPPHFDQLFKVNSPFLRALPGTSFAETSGRFAPKRVSRAIGKFVSWMRAGDGSQEVFMQRTWMRTLVVVAVAAVSLLATSEADAQGPVRRLLRRTFRRDNVVYADTYVDANGNRWTYRDGYAYGRYDADGRWMGPVFRSARGGARVETRFDGQVSPATRIEADADANVNRNDGTIRGNVDGRASGSATTPPEATRTPTQPNRSALPPPLSDAPEP
jgi:hypothetical protein